MAALRSVKAATLCSRRFILAGLSRLAATCCSVAASPSLDGQDRHWKYGDYLGFLCGGGPPSVLG